MIGSGISYMIGKIGALLGGPWGAIIGGAYFVYKLISLTWIHKVHIHTT